MRVGEDRSSKSEVQSSKIKSEEDAGNSLHFTGLESVGRARPANPKRRAKHALLWSLCAAILQAAAVLAIGGCRSGLTVSVHRVIVPTADRLQSDSPLGRRVATAAADLQEFVECAAAAEGAARRLADEDADWKGPLSRYQETVRQAREEGARLLSRCRSLFSESAEASHSADALGLGFDAQVVLEGVHSFFATSAAQLRTLQEDVCGIPSLASLCVMGGAPNKCGIQEIIALAGAAQARSRPGAMGMTRTDVYEINPSDPNYRRIFAAGGAQISKEPITEARIDAIGESALMIVLEHAGQVRVYQVSNDPTRITRNVAMLVDKATAAVAKFAAAE